MEFYKRGDRKGGVLCADCLSLAPVLDGGGSLVVQEFICVLHQGHGGTVQ